MAPGIWSSRPRPPPSGTTTTCVQLRKCSRDVGDLRETVERLPAVVVAVDGDQHHRRDLAEPIENALDAEVRRARRPHRAQARPPPSAATIASGTLAIMPQTRSPARDAARAERLGGARDLAREFAVGDPALRARFRHRE